MYPFFFHQIPKLLYLGMNRLVIYLKYPGCFCLIPARISQCSSDDFPFDGDETLLEDLLEGKTSLEWQYCLPASLCLLKEKD